MKRQSDHSLFTCPGCHSRFESNQALSTHQSKSFYCIDYITSAQHTSTLIPQLNTNKDENKNNENMPTKENNDIPDNNFNFELDSNNNDSESINSGNSTSKQTFYYSNEIIHEIKLLKILMDIGAPLYAYQTIMEWAHEAYMSKYKFDTKRKTYQQTIKYLEDDLQFNICRPENIPVTLCHDNRLVNVVVFDVKKMIASLFADPTLNQYKNLVVNPRNRFSKYEPADDRYGEVNSGVWYQKAYANCVQNPDKDFLCPIILSNDKTTLSDIGDLHIEAIFLTSSLFNVVVSTEFTFFLN